MIEQHDLAKYRSFANGERYPMSIDYMQAIKRLVKELKAAEAHWKDRATQAEAERDVLAAWCRSLCHTKPSSNCPANGPCDHTSEDVECIEIIAEWTKQEVKKYKEMEAKP